MARRRKATKRPVSPDPLYESEVVAGLINTVMNCGKKATAQKVVYNAIKIANGEEHSGDPLEVLLKAVENIKPRIEVKARRVGGATYQVPMEVTPERQMALAMRWLVGYAGGRKGTPMSKALAYEIKEAANGQGSAIKKRDDVHRMAQANKAFAHLRW